MFSTLKCPADMADMMYDLNHYLLIFVSDIDFLFHLSLELECQIGDFREKSKGSELACYCYWYCYLFTVNCNCLFHMTACHFGIGLT